MVWFLYDGNLRHGRVKVAALQPETTATKKIFFRVFPLNFVEFSHCVKYANFVLTVRENSYFERKHVRKNPYSNNI